MPSLRDRLGGIFGKTPPPSPPSEAPSAAASPLIGREQELDELVRIAEGTEGGTGRLVLVEGRMGYGKSGLLAELGRRVGAAEEPGAPEFVLVACYETGAAIPLSAFADVLGELTRTDHRRVKARRVAEIVDEVAPLLQFVPVAGVPLSAGVKAATSLTLRSLGNDPKAEQAQRSADVAAALTAIAEREAALVVAIDDAHWLDQHSVDAVLRLMRVLPAAPLTLVLAYDLDLLEAEAPLRAVLAESAKTPGSVTRLTLKPFSVDDVRRLIEASYGSDVEPNLAPWLAEAAEGNPLFTDTYLRALLEHGVIRQENGRHVLAGAIEGEPGAWSLSGAIAELPAPASLLELLRRRVEVLDDDERRVLDSGAIQGKRFLTAVLARLLDEKETAVLDRLHRIQERRRVIAFDTTEDWWTPSSDLCTFAPGPIRELFYERYQRTARERMTRHRAVAKALEELVEEIPGEPPRRVRLEIAEHYAAGGENVEAAKRFLDIAEATNAEGGAGEAEIQAGRALALLRKADGPPDDRLLARTIALLVVASELHWTGDQTVAGVPLAQLVDEGEAAANRTGDASLRADALYAKSFFLFTFGRLDHGLDVLRVARKLAREAGDPVAEAAILVELGHHLDQHDLPAGRAVVQEAFDLVAGGALADRVPPAQLELIEAHVESAIGVAEFDLGNYGVALPHLRSAPDRLRKVRALELAGYSFSFLAQLYAAIGLFEEAEATVREALALFADEERPLSVRGYLKSLLGHVLLESDPPRVDEARSALLDGREESRVAGKFSVQQLVWNYYAELLLATGDEASLREADAVLDEAIAMSEQVNWQRGAIGGRALQARVALRLGDRERALALSQAAADALVAAGGEVPVYRSEEIFFTRARILEETGASDPAEWLAAARGKVDEKAASLEDPAHRNAFLTRVRLTRAIVAATGGSPQT